MAPGKSIIALDPRGGPALRRAACLHDEIGFLWARLTGGIATSKWQHMRIGVAATFPGEGTTSVAANCAIYLAQHGKRVVLLEANLRRPGLAQHFGVARGPGFWELVENPASAKDGVCRQLAPGLELVPAGGVPDRFTPHLDALSVGKAIQILDQRCDILVFDLPPLSTSPEVVAYLSHVDTVVLVARANRTSKRELKRSVKALADLGVSLAGTVLNDCRYDVPAFLAKVP